MRSADGRLTLTSFDGYDVILLTSDWLPGSGSCGLAAPPPPAWSAPPPAAAASVGSAAVC